MKHAQQVNEYVRRNHAREVVALAQNTRIFPHMVVVPTPEEYRFDVEWNLVVCQETTVDAIFEATLNRGCFNHVVFAIPDTPSVIIAEKVFRT